MSTKRETRLQRKIQDAIRREFPGVWLFKTHGSPFQPTGLPDIIGCLNGLFFGLEVKNPDGIESDHQRDTIEDIIDAGGVAAFVRSPQEAIDVLSEASTSRDRRARPRTKDPSGIR